MGNGVTPRKGLMIDRKLKLLKNEITCFSKYWNGTLFMYAYVRARKGERKVSFRGKLFLYNALLTFCIYLFYLNLGILS